MQFLQVLGVPEVVLEIEWQDKTAIGETQLGSNGSAQVSCVDSTLPDAPKMVARTPE